MTIKFANSNLEGLFIMNLYQLEKQSTKFTNLEVRRRLREKVRRKRPELFGNNSCILHHDNAPTHTTLFVREFLATKQITVLEHAVYSPATTVVFSKGVCSTFTAMSS